MFLALAAVACAPFDCVVVGEGTVAEARYMRSSPDTECAFTTSAASEGYTAGSSGGTAADLVMTYTLRAVLGGLALLCCVAFIALIYTTLRRGRARLFTDEAFLRTHGALYLRYDEAAYYWEVLVMTRKLLLVLVEKALSAHQPAQLGCCAAVLGGALALQRRVKPFASDALDALEEHTLTACVAIVLLGAAAHLGAPPVAVAALYFAAVAVAAAVIGRDLRAVWAEGGAEKLKIKAKVVFSKRSSSSSSSRSSNNSNSSNSSSSSSSSSSSAPHVVAAAGGAAENPLGLSATTLATLDRVKTKGPDEKESAAFHGRAIRVQRGRRLVVL